MYSIKSISSEILLRNFTSYKTLKYSIQHLNLNTVQWVFSCYRRGVLHMSEGIEYMGIPQWPIMLCLAAAWTLTFLALSKGVKSTGKVSYVMLRMILLLALT